jgi:hypothetical protein
MTFKVNVYEGIDKIHLARTGTERGPTLNIHITRQTGTVDTS